MIERNARPETFDAVIFASHADASRGMLDAAYEEQKLALGSLRFSQNTAYLHHDASLMQIGRASCRERVSSPV